MSTYKHACLRWKDCVNRDVKTIDPRTNRKKMLKTVREMMEKNLFYRMALMTNKKKKNVFFYETCRVVLTFSTSCTIPDFH